MTHRTEHRRRPDGPATADPLLLPKVLSRLDVGVYVTDEQERIVAVNPRAEELLVRPAASLVGRNAHDLLHRGAGGTPLPRAQCQLMKVFRRGRAGHGGSKWFVRGDGTLLPVVWLITPYQLADGSTGVAVLFHERAAEQSKALGSVESADHVAALSALADSLSLISATTTVLASNLEMAETLRRLVRLVLPYLADWAVVDLINEDGDLQRVAVMHYQDEQHVRLEELEGPLPSVSPHSVMPLSRVLMGAPVTRLSPDDYTDPLDSDMAVVQRRLFEATGMRSAIAAPLRGRGDEVLGVLTLGRSGQRPDFDSTEIMLVDDIAHQAGLALDYEQQRRVAEAMQRYLLPQLPRVPGMALAARYHPAPHSSRVGGDWYDAFVLPDGTLALVLGDVMGHDLHSAARMAEVRSMLRAFAWDFESPPGVIVSRLDRALAAIGVPTMASLVLTRIDRLANGSWRLHWTNAGHPPPLLVSSDGGARFLGHDSDLLLGIAPSAGRHSASLVLEPSATVVLYTDGLVESPSRPIDAGLAALRRHAAELARGPLTDLCQGLIERVRPSDNDDDVVLLALRVAEDGGSASSGEGVGSR